ncbi:LptA/OstA family protein [Pseudomonas aeruginosa]
MAPPSDREQPIRVQADSAELDDKQGVAVYRGDVVVTQGSTKLTGNTVTLKQDRERRHRGRDLGRQTAYHAEQKPAPDKDVTKAYGLTIQVLRHAEPGRADRPGQGDPGRQHLRRREDRLRHPAPDRQRGSSTGSQVTSPRPRIDMVIQPKKKAQ